MSKQIAVIGLGKFGVNLASALHNGGYDVLAIDKVADIVENIAPNVGQAVRADATNESVLKKLGITNFNVAVVAIGAAIQESVMVTILLKKLGVRHVVARADNELHGSILEKIGADKVVYPERDTALRIAPILNLRDVNDYIPITSGSGASKVMVPPYFVGKTLLDIGFGPGGKREVVVLLIQRGKEAIINPSLQEVVSHIDVLLVTGNDSEVEKLFAEAEKTAQEEEQKENNNKH
ncbi:MAG: TrkA family potassium uptake protein [Dehalococcoidales bacterium]|nr:TrkA family potassium uptake protein [Dehalococcoidales bacterium]